MNGYGEEYGVSYRTLHKIFEVLKQKESNAEAVQRSKTILSEASQVRINANAASKKLFSDEANSYNSAVATSADDINTDTLPFSYKVEVSMMEIYNDQVYDLLSGAAEESLDIRQAGDGTVHVPGLKQVPVFGLEDVLQVFAKGSANRATAATNLNELSSRSHSVLSVDVTTVTNGTPVRAKLFLVDLAGSERAGKSGVTGAQMKETQFINKSLSALGDVMEALDQKAKHVPYRNSKLTYLLQDSLGGNSRTMMIVTVCPTESTIEETMFTLGFASRVRNVSLGVARKNINVKNFEEALKIAKNEIRDGKKSRLQLEETINDLKKQLKKTSEKMTTQTESKSKAYDEAKKSNELQLQLIGKTNQELTARLQEEREAKLKVQQEVELMQKTLKKANDQLKENLRERERLLLVVKQREDASIKQQEKDTDSGKDSARNYDKTEKSAVTPMTPNSALTSSTLSRPAVRASAAALSNSSGHLGPPRRDPRESVSSFAIPSRVPVRRLTTTTATSGIALATGRSDEDNTSLNGDVITQSSAVSTPSKSVTSVYDRLTLSNASQRSSRKADIPTTAFGSSIAPSSSRAARSYNKPPPMALTDVNTFVSASVTDSDSNPTATASLSPSHIPVSSMASLRLSISSRSKEALQRHQERMDKYRQSHGTSS